MKEEWKNIIGFENLYQISSLGRVKSLGNGKTWKKKEKIIKQVINKDNYCYIMLYKEGKRKNYKVHRLVAQAFLPNPQNLPQVNHKDENPSNNCVDNLEWCTAKYNCNYGNHKENLSKSIKGKNKGKQTWWIGRKHKPETIEKFRNRKLTQEEINKRIKKIQKPIVQLTKNGDFIKCWESIIQVERELNILATNISRCCKGKLKTCRGFKWKYLQDYINEQIQYLNELKEYKNRLYDILKNVS